MKDDKVTIGLNSRGREIIEIMMESGFYNTQIDAAKSALALAIKSKIKPGIADGASTVWNIGSFDPEGELRDLLPMFYDDINAPYSLVEFLINEGLDIIGKSIEDSGTYDLRKILED